MYFEHEFRLVSPTMTLALAHPHFILCRGTIHNNCERLDPVFLRLSLLSTTMSSAESPERP
jgi:hypothetical protein